MELQTVKQGSTPTIPIKKAESILEYTSVIFTFIDTAGTKLKKIDPDLVVSYDGSEFYEINFSQTELSSFVAGKVLVEGQYVIGPSSSMTGVSSFTLVASIGGYELVDGSGGIFKSPIELELSTPFVKATNIVSSNVKSVNDKVPDELGNIVILAGDIKFTDDDTIQQKFDNGSLKGDNGADGTDGTNGIDGGTFTPNVTISGDTLTINWNNDVGLDNPESVSINIPKGPKGDNGSAFTYDMFTQEQLNSLKGPQGPKGVNGADGTDGLTTSITLNGIKYEVDSSGNITLPTVEMELTNSAGVTNFYTVVGTRN